MVPSDTHSSGPSSSTDDSDSEGGGGEHDSDSREEGTHAREPTSVGLEPLSPATTAGEFPSDTQEIVERLARGLSLDYGSPEVPEAPSLLSMGGLGARQRREEPALKFPSNIAETWLKYDEKTPEGKPTVDLSFHSYADVLRVSDDDYVTLLRVPGMDDDVAKFLPSDGKTSPMRYSQYWEEQLKVLDTRARVLLKLSCFSYLLSNHLGNQIVDSSGRECAMWRECNLAASLATTSMHEAMLLSRRTVILRRGNACASLESTFNKDLSEDLKKVDVAQATLFGNSFCGTVERLADKVTKEHTLQERTDALSKSDKTKSNKKNKKNKRNKKRSASSTRSAGASNFSRTVPQTSTPKPSAAAASSAKGTKRAGTGTGGKPPQSKRFRGGKQSRT